MYGRTTVPSPSSNSPVSDVVVVGAGHNALACAAYLMGVAGRVVSASVTGGRSWPDAVAHPISIGVFAWLVARSLRLRRRGQLSWRGRPV